MSAAKIALLRKDPNDIVVLSALRTPITKARKGPFASTHPEFLLSHVLKAVYTDAGLDPKHIEDVVVGNVLPPGGGATAARMACLHAGLPVEVGVGTVNRQCSSGLTAVSMVASMIRSGQIDIGIGAGVESMSLGYGPQSISSSFSAAVLSDPRADDCLLPMGITSENVASDYNVSRLDQDAFAALSFQRAASAQKADKFSAEITPVLTEEQVLVRADDGIRDGVTKESLAKLKPAFKEGGTTHAGNASQVSDGAAAVLLARRSVAEKLGLGSRIRGKYVQAAVVGVEPKVMGIGPAYAIPKVLQKTGLTLDDVDFFEINEAFASQALYCIRELGISGEKVNVHGGAIALGHPLGCTGARQVATGLNIAKQYDHRIFVTSMCIGSGMGMAAVFVSEH